MILYKILAPILSILAKLFMGVTEDLVVAKNNYYSGSKLESGLGKAMDRTKHQRVMAKCYVKGFIIGVNTPVNRRNNRRT